MNSTESVVSTVEYGRKLVNAGISGIRNGQSALQRQPPAKMISDAARCSAMLAVAGASLGLLGSYVRHRRRRPSHAFAYGLLGTAVGLCAGLSWKYREVASDLAHSAMREMSKVSDEHWLESHPIDYA